VLSYSRGALGGEVNRLQSRLSELGFYTHAIDAEFGSGTEAAVRAFQSHAAIQPTGVVDAVTWAALFPGETIPAPALLSAPVVARCLALTGTFETSRASPLCFSCLSGDFDGQGMSFGALQWNLGRGTLQPLLKAMDDRHPDILGGILKDKHAELQAVLGRSQPEQLAWARSIQDRQHAIVEPWRSLFVALGAENRFQDIQLESAGTYRTSALQLWQQYALASRRALALMFDIAVQNGSIDKVVHDRIIGDFERVPSDGDDAEVARMRIIANRRAEAAAPQWVEDVRARKLVIANGQGALHGRQFDLAQQFGLDLTQVGPEDLG
jgi:hypothetical protein